MDVECPQGRLTEYNVMDDCGAVLHNIETKWLYDFLTLEKCRNFSQAAVSRNVSQPAFSRRIRALEQAIGVELFNRQVTPVIWPQILFLVSVTVGQTAIPEPLRPTPKAANSFMLISNLHKLAGYLRRIWALFLMLKAP